MQRIRAEQERNRNYRAVYHLADKRFVQLATPELPTVNPGDDAARTLGTSDIPYRMEMSWDQTYNDVFLLDIKTGKPNRILEHFAGGAPSMSPGGKACHLLRREGRSLVFLSRGRRRSRESDRQNHRALPAGERHAGPARRLWRIAGWTADDRSVLLYDQFDIWEVKPDGSGAQRDQRRGTQAADRLPVSLVRSGGTDRAGRTSRCSSPRPMTAPARPASTSWPT